MGSTPEVAEEVDQLYASIITAGTYKAESIRIAEAAKVIENTQRDLNIALVNNLSIIFNKMEIDTDAVLKAARTKWISCNSGPASSVGIASGWTPIT
ncbi:capsular polysaccharide biosynthesis protein/UDP-glucose dehydrogenase/GDP mannose family protein, putati [Roseobacter sp. AzwK-3b]|nr:capsular polysaccharide biosynthesis protein/UDP-glucose dehydrogenase/GDP mannose family protein, putati [Roseobacter sp. AzwK-3b]